MKYIFVVALLFSGQLMAKCDSNELEIGLDIRIDKNAYQSSPNHAPLNIYTVTAKEEVNGYKLDSMELMKGEVTEFLIPLKTGKSGKNGELAISQFVSSKEYADTLDVLITYKKLNCYKDYSYKVQ